MKVDIDVRPFVCPECGQLQLQSDICSRCRPGNCDNQPECGNDHPFVAGPHQKIKIEIYESAVEAFERGEKR